jgi:uncharacterized protein involved in exopolysaccharide biosynthesis
MGGLLVAAVITYVMPKIYESEAVIEVKPRALGIDSHDSVTNTSQFVATEFEVMKSRNSLEKAVANLELVNRWMVDKETAIQILKGIVTTQNIRGTDLISIRVRHTNKVDARDIAAEVANAYKQYRAEIEERAAEAMLRELNKAVRDQEDKVEERRKLLATIVRTKGIIFRAGDSNKAEAEEDGSRGAASAQATEPALDAQDYVDAKRKFEMEQELLQALKLKQMGETIARKIPGESVELHESPTIGRAPVSPNVTLNLSLGTVLGLVFSPLMALPLMWLLNRPKTVKV